MKKLTHEHVEIQYIQKNVIHSRGTCMTQKHRQRAIVINFSLIYYASFVGQRDTPGYIEFSDNISST